MLQIQEDLVHRINTLEKELQVLMEGKQREFRYFWSKGTATFEKGAVSEHRKLKSGLGACPSNAPRATRNALA